MIDSTLLSRIQFGFTMTAHIIYPSISIGVVTFLVIFEGLYLATRNKIYLAICKFWTKIFALTFGMGVVSGIVMEFQFGTNWRLPEKGSILGALFTYEVLTILLNLVFLVSCWLASRASILALLCDLYGRIWYFYRRLWSLHHGCKPLTVIDSENAASWLRMVGGMLFLIHQYLDLPICSSCYITQHSSF